jgi:ribonucleoside-diphosphate reductase alpha chain/ribonucleoside-triphosphate reductase
MEKMRYSGEPAFVNEEAAARRRPNFKGVNPCAEILLDNKGMCNLTTVNVMAFVKNDELDWDGLMEAQRLSARAGYRMTCIDLELSKWNANQQRDKLIGCSLTGWQDMVNALQFTKEDEKILLQDLRETAQYAAKMYAKALGQKAPLLVTTIKPEGTLSQLPVVSSGIHYSHSPYYIRRIRVNAQDPIIQVCEELGYDIKPENGQSIETCKTKVVAFPVKAPQGITKYDISAIEQLENYKMFMEYYVDHNTSITVHVRDNEWEEVEQWMWDNWNDVVAISFLSLDNHFYEQAPYEAITEEQYNKMMNEIPNFIPSLITKYEQEEIEMDASADPSCASGACPIR